MAADQSLTMQLTLSKAWRLISATFDKLAKRFDMLANMMTVVAFNRAVVYGLHYGEGVRP